MVKLEHEKSRIYVFPNGGFYAVTNVKELLVSKSGGHRLTTADGLLVYVPFTWLAIEIESETGWEA